jgi:hypothetical protein
MGMQADDNGNPIQVLTPKMGRTQVLNIGVTAVPSLVMTSETIRFCNTAACCFSYSASPTATVNDVYLPAGNVEYFRIPIGSLVSVIGFAPGGKIYLTEMV